MKKTSINVIVLFFISAVFCTNFSYSFSINKPLHSYEILKYEKGSEFIKLSFQQFAALAGIKETLGNKLSFNMMKIQVKHDLKKNPDVKLSDYANGKHKMGTGLKILLWVLGIFLVLIIVIAIIFGGQTK